MTQQNCNALLEVNNSHLNIYHATRKYIVNTLAAQHTTKLVTVYRAYFCNKWWNLSYGSRPRYINSQRQVIFIQVVCNTGQISQSHLLDRPLVLNKYVPFKSTFTIKGSFYTNVVYIAAYCILAPLMNSYLYPCSFVAMIRQVTD